MKWVYPEAVTEDGYYWTFSCDITDDVPRIVDIVRGRVLGPHTMWKDALPPKAGWLFYGPIEPPAKPDEDMGNYTPRNVW